MADRTIIHIDLDSFFVSVEQALNPDLRGKPVVVGGRPGGRGVVATASYEARRFGLHSAMPIATAVRLCPQAIFIEGNYATYREYSKKFMSILNDFTPFVEPMGIDEAYLGVTGFDSIHGSIRKMAGKIKQRIHDELAITASIGIAGCKVVAKIASDFSKPDGLVEVKTGEERDFLATLPLEKLPGAGKHAVQVLGNLGVRTIGDLARLSASTVRLRLGSSGEWLQKLASGKDDRAVTPPGEAKSMSRETTFQEDTRDRQFLEARLWRQCEKLGADLRRKHRLGKTLTLKVRFADFTTITRSQTLREGIDTDSAIFEKAKMLLDKALAADRQSVRLLGIGVANLVEGNLQAELFSVSNAKLEALYKAVDRIRDRYGFESIKTGRGFHLRDERISSMD